MKKIVIGSIVAMACIPAIAEWVKVGESDLNSTYFDPQTIQKSGGSVKVWVLNDFFSTDRNGATSLKTLEEFNCPKAESRTLDSTIYSGHMGNGKALDSWKSEKPLRPVPPKSLRWSMLNKVC